MVKRKDRRPVSLPGWMGGPPCVRPRVFPERTLVMSKKITIKAGSRRMKEPRLVGNIVKEMLQGWKVSTELCVDLKTRLRSDERMTTGKAYRGVLRHDVECEDFRYDSHYTFTESLPEKEKRNPHLFQGRYITVTQRDDGTPRLNFKPLPNDGRGFNLERYALGVYNEICMALAGLVEEV